MLSSFKKKHVNKMTFTRNIFELRVFLSKKTNRIAFPIGSFRVKSRMAVDGPSPKMTTLV